MYKDQEDQEVVWCLIAGATVATGGAAVMAALALQAALEGNEPPAAAPAGKAPIVEQFKGACAEARTEQQAGQLTLVVPKGCSLKPS